MKQLALVVVFLTLPCLSTAGPRCSLTTINGDHRIVYEASTCTFDGPPYVLQIAADSVSEFDYPLTGPLPSTGPSIVMDIIFNNQEIITSGWIAYFISSADILSVWVDIDTVFKSGFE